MKPNDDVTVRALLKAAGIEPPEDEVEALVRSYASLRAAADGLYTKEASRYLPAHEPSDAGMEAK